MIETIPLTSGATHYGCFFQAANVFNASSQTMVAAAGATEAQCAVALTEIATSGLFVPSSPVGLPAGVYTWIIFRRAGATPAFRTDPRRWVDDQYEWDGSARKTLSAVQAAVQASVTVTVTPILAAANNPRYATRDLAPIATASAPTEIWTLVDGNGIAINLSAKTLRVVVGLVDDQGTDDADDPFDDTIAGSFKYETGGSGITVGGAGNNLVTLVHSSAKTATAGDFRYWLWNVTDKIVLATGAMPIVPSLFDV